MNVDKIPKGFLIAFVVSIALNIFLLLLCLRDNSSGTGDVLNHSQQLGAVQQQQDATLRDAKETNNKIRDTNSRLSEIERDDAARIKELKRILQGVQQRAETKTP